MAESVDALVSNTSGATRAGSTPALGTRKRVKYLQIKYLALSFFILKFPNCSRISSYKLLKKVLSYKYRELTVFCI